MKTINPHVNLRQKEVIVGTILGGSSIVKPPKGNNCYLSMRSKDAKWLEYKADVLKPFASEAPYTIPKTGNTYRWHSMCFPIFNEYRELFYPNDKRSLNIEILNPLRDWGLATWFVDCGKFIKNKIVMNTNIWKEEGSNVIMDYFQELGYNVYKKLDRGGIRIVLDEKSSKHFLRIITAQLPVFVARK